MTVQNPHDRFFRESFSRPEIVRNYLEEYLPANLRNVLDLDHLTLQDSAFIDETMQEHQTDLLYEVELVEGDKAYIYFLFEHKSYPDPLVALQLMRYQIRFWERQVKEKEALSPIIPLVIYHGEKTWTAPTDFLSLMDFPEGVRPYLPDFHYHLSDFSHLSDETIRGEVWLRVCLAIMRGILNPNLRAELGNLITLLFELGKQQTGLEYIRTTLYYLTKATGKIKRDDLEAELLRQGAQGEQIMTTIAQEYVQEGIQQGKLEEKQEMARKLLKILSVKQVSKITGLTVNELIALQEVE